MRRIAVGGYRAWVLAARRLLAAGTPPEEVRWCDPAEAAASPLAVEFITAPPDGPGLGEASSWSVLAACHRDGRRWDLLYRLWWRLCHGEPDLLHLASDPDVRRVQLMAQEVGRDLHHLQAFARFRRMGGVHVAWHRSDHDCLHLAVPFFAARFGSEPWSLATPWRTAVWDGTTLRFAPGQERPAHGDRVEDSWGSAYSADVTQVVARRIHRIHAVIAFHHRVRLTA